MILSRSFRIFGPLVLNILSLSLFAEAAPPFRSTIHFSYLEDEKVVHRSAEMINDSDPSSFIRLGKVAEKAMVGDDQRVRDTDGRVAGFRYGKPVKRGVKVWYWKPEYENGHSFEIQVNQEDVDFATARQEALYTADYIGRLPDHLVKAMPNFLLHGGNQSWVVIRKPLRMVSGIGYNRKMMLRGVFEELAMHELVHADLQHFKDDPKWVAAQKADGEFITRYAKNFPLREDLASSYNAWFTLRYRSGRVEAEILRRIQETIPNRMKFFDSLKLDVSNIEDDHSLLTAGEEVTEDLRLINGVWVFTHRYPRVLMVSFDGQKLLRFRVGGRFDNRRRSFEGGFSLWRQGEGNFHSRAASFPDVYSFKQGKIISIWDLN